MGESSFNMEGIDEMISKLDNMDNRVNRGINRVLRKSAEPLKDKIEDNVNRSDKDGTHAKDDVIVGSVRNASSGTRDTKYVEVGYTSATGWRMRFVEFGTIYQKPQNNISRAIPDAESEVNKVQVEGLRELIIFGSN